MLIPYQSNSREKIWYLCSIKKDHNSTSENYLVAQTSGGYTLVSNRYVASKYGSRNEALAIAAMLTKGSK
tara:strand:- start:10834 stop:11043 length:210 start_codon:yes stop_codon:yes gene_type:complete